METIIDIQLVKEQLRLLGHDVADQVILDFVKGLNKGTKPLSATVNTTLSHSGDMQGGVGDGAALARPQQHSSAPGHSQQQPLTAMWQGQAGSDAAPSRMNQACDQHSPKRLPPTAGSGSGGAVECPPPASLQHRAALDQRCRNFLARCTEKPVIGHVQSQQSAPDHMQQADTAEQGLFLEVPRPQGAANSQVSCRSQHLASSSSELLLGDSDSDADGLNGDGCIMQHNRYVPTGGVPQHEATSQNWSQLQAQQHGLQHQQLQQEWVHPAEHTEDLEADPACSSDSDCSSLGPQPEGSKFLLHQAATMQRVRARLAAKMAQYTATAAAAPDGQPHAASGAADSISPCSREAAASAGVAGPSSEQPRVDLRHVCSNSGHFAEAAADEDAAGAVASSLPRFGFRPGYRPVGVHMPPPPSTAAVEALAAARSMRQQALPASAAQTRAGLAHVAAQHLLDLPLHMHNLHPGAKQHTLQEYTQQQEVDSKQDPMMLPITGTSSGLHLVASPGKPAGVGSVPGLLCSGSIIAGEASPYMAAAGGKPRQSPKVDPLYLAPSSPRRSTTATPRSSPAMSPAPLAPLPSVAVGRALMRSPVGAAPPAALAAARRRTSDGTGSSSSSSRHALLSPGTRGSQGRSGVHPGQHGSSGTRRSASAPPTPVATAPAVGAASRGMSSSGSSSAAGNIGTSSSSVGRTRSCVSHESLYCQRLAYSNQRSTVAPGVRKTDRVARYQEMQQQWQRDRFLCSGAGGATAAAKKAGAQPSQL